MTKPLKGLSQELPQETLKSTQDYILTKSDIAAIPETKHVHQFNDNAIRHTVSLSDIVGFPAYGAAHSMRNDSDSDATYLMGGSRPPIDITNYPDIKRRMYKIHGEKEFVDLEDLGKV